MARKKPILITGSHRSGTTWVAQMLSVSPSVCPFINEPFNVDYPPGVGICSAKFKYWFTYVTDENEQNFYNHFKKMVEFRYNLVEELKMVESFQEKKKAMKKYRSFSNFSASNVVPLIKDPIAFFSSEWLSRRFDMNVLVLIRHPAAFVSSLKRLNWTFDFTHFLKQPYLMRDHLYPFEAEIGEFAQRNYDILDQAILLWKIIHHVIAKYRSNNKEWLFLRHEDISKDPLQCFENIFKVFNIDFTQKVRDVIQEYSMSSNPSEAPSGIVHYMKRDSKSNISNWKKRLTESEIRLIRDQVEDISKEFYGEDDW